MITILISSFISNTIIRRNATTIIIIIINNVIITIIATGILNVFNPNKPEGSWLFDLQRYDERQVAKLMIHLSVVEPGENCK